MRKLNWIWAAALAAIASAALLGPAGAADLPVLNKAAPKALAFPYQGSGFYFGIDTKGGVQNASNSGTILGSAFSGSLTASGASVGGDLGWMHGMGNAWVALEASLYYSNITGGGTAVTPIAGGVSAAVPVSYASRWSSDQVIKVGGLTNILSWLPNIGINFPALPTPPAIPGIPTIPNNAHPYVMAGIEEFGISGNFFTAGGTEVGVAPLVGAGILNQIADTNGQPTGAVLDVFGQVVFGNRGLDVAGLFKAGGPTPVVGTLNIGNKYEAGAKIHF